MDDGDLNQERTAAEVMAEIDRSLEDGAVGGQSHRVRAGAIGGACMRSLIYDFLWASPVENPKARTLRIFAKGHAEEDNLIADLKRAGWEILNRDPANPKKQISIASIYGHFFGYVDGIGRDKHNNGPWRVIECKTHNDKSFKELVKKGVAGCKPEHHGQMQSYMHILELSGALYIAVNKNTEEIYVEYVAYDPEFCERLMDKAAAIIAKDQLAPRISTNPDAFGCRFCKHKGVCHEGRAVERNCRTCEHSKPIANGQWGCKKHSCEISKELMQASCGDYEIMEILKQ